MLIAKEVEDDGRVSVLKDARVEIWQVTGGTNWGGTHGGKLEIFMVIEPGYHGLGGFFRQMQKMQILKPIQWIEHDVSKSMVDMANIKEHC